MHSGQNRACPLSTRTAEFATLVGVTMSIHKLTAGSGYDYLTRQVAAQDRTEGARPGLASYYTERGETPGVWVGSGLAGIDGLAVGDEVTAAQMQSLFGSGHHPLAQQRQEQLQGPGLTENDYRAVARFGAPYPVYPGDVSRRFGSRSPHGSLTWLPRRGTRGTTRSPSRNAPGSAPRSPSSTSPRSTAGPLPTPGRSPPPSPHTRGSGPPRSPGTT